MLGRGWVLNGQVFPHSNTFPVLLFLRYATCIISSYFGNYWVKNGGGITKCKKYRRNLCTAYYAIVYQNIESDIMLSLIKLCVSITWIKCSLCFHVIMLLWTNRDDQNALPYVL